MQAVTRTVERVAPTGVSVMLLGASGTGKELLARGLHDASGRKGAFVAINCAAIPDTLLESELFGHERGAFTGAVKTTEGKIELAHGGTLFLDEIGDVPLALQVKLLRFLQERVIERIGGRKAIPVDVRIVCATHRERRCDGRRRHRSAKTSITASPRSSSASRRSPNAPATPGCSRATCCANMPGKWAAPPRAWPTTRSPRSTRTPGPATSASSKTA